MDVEQVKQRSSFNLLARQIWKQPKQKVISLPETYISTNKNKWKTTRNYHQRTMSNGENVITASAVRQIIMKWKFERKILCDTNSYQIFCFQCFINRRLGNRLYERIVSID